MERLHNTVTVPKIILVPTAPQHSNIVPLYSINAVRVLLTFDADVSPKQCCGSGSISNDTDQDPTKTIENRK